MEKARLDRMTNIIQLTKLFVKVEPIAFSATVNLAKLCLSLKVSSECRKNNVNYFKISTRRSEIILVTL